MGNLRKIETEEQYQNSLAWLVEKAKLLEHPLFSGDERTKLEKLYDFVSDNVREYNIRQSAESDPYMKEVYERAGQLPAELNGTSEAPEVKELPKKESEPTKQVDLSSWLNDD